MLSLAAYTDIIVWMQDIILMGNFNIDILKYDTNNDSAEFLDMMYEKVLLPYISSPIRAPPDHKL